MQNSRIPKHFPPTTTETARKKWNVETKKPGPRRDDASSKKAKISMRHMRRTLRKCKGTQSSITQQAELKLRRPTRKQATTIVAITTSPTISSYHLNILFSSSPIYVYSFPIYVYPLNIYPFIPLFYLIYLDKFSRNLTNL